MIESLEYFTHITLGDRNVGYALKVYLGHQPLGGLPQHSHLAEVDEEAAMTAYQSMLGAYWFNGFQGVAQRESGSVTIVVVENIDIVAGTLHADDLVGGKHQSYGTFLIHKLDRIILSLSAFLHLMQLLLRLNESRTAVVNVGQQVEGEVGEHECERRIERYGEQMVCIGGMEEERYEEVDEEDVGQHLTYLPEDEVGIAAAFLLGSENEQKRPADQVDQEDDGCDDGDAEGAVVLPSFPDERRFSRDERVVDEPEEEQEYGR